MKQQDELKKLKDIEFIRSTNNVNFFKQEDLRQEAIKWIKELQNKVYNNKKLKDEIYLQMKKENASIGQINYHQQSGIIAHNHSFYKGSIQILMEFFNITDEELK